MSPGRAPTRRTAAQARALTTQMLACACLLEGLPHAAWLVEISSRHVMAINDAAVTLLGRPRAELEGASAEGLVASPEDLAWWDEAAVAEPSPLYSNTVLGTDDGRALHVSRSIRVVHLQLGKAGTVPHALVMMADRRAEQEADLQREALLLLLLPLSLGGTAPVIICIQPVPD